MRLAEFTDKHRLYGMKKISTGRYAGKAVVNKTVFPVFTTKEYNPFRPAYIKYTILTKNNTGGLDLADPYFIIHN